MAKGSLAVGLIVGAACAQVFPSSAAPPAARTPAPIVYFDIAGPDAAKQADFYRKVFGWTSGPGGALSIAISGPKLNGTLRTDPAAKGLYIGVPDVTASLKEIAANGGKILAPRFEVKGVVVLGLFADPAGNSLGVVELTADGRVKVP